MQTMTNVSETTPKGVDKITRYKWTVKDSPGVLQMLSKDVLQVHSAYQRDLLDDKSISIAASWSWVACGAIVVGRRSGEFWVIDGQHRVVAAKRRSDITHLPCLVFETADVAQEAKGFLALNTLRKPITVIAKQKAMFAAGDEIAQIVQEELNKNGLRATSAGSHKGTIKALGWCHKKAAENKETFAVVLGLAAEMCALDQISVHERLLKGLWYLNSNLEGGLENRRLVKRLREKGAAQILVGIAKACQYYGSGGEKMCANGILTEINKGLQQRFELIEK